MHSGKLSYVICILFGILLLNLACGQKSSTGGDNDNGTTEASIGPEGGTLLLDDDIVLTVQSGSLTDTIDISIAVNSSPAALSGALKFVSPVFTIGPSGTDFSIPSFLWITYNEALCGSFPENSIVIYAHDGTSWNPLTTTISALNNEAKTTISHLSDFAAVIDTTISTEGAFAAMVIGRAITNISGYQTRIDLIMARFDTSYAPCDPISPVQVNSITCNEYSLDWDADLNSYQYMEVFDNPEFIELGEDYIFTITGNTNVPSFADTITYPVNETYVTSPTYYSTVSLSGFNVVWESGNSAGTVMLFLMDFQNDTTVYIETNNDGAYTFNSTALSGLTAGQYGLVMIHENWDYITAEGIDPRSFIRARVINTTPIILQ